MKGDTPNFPIVTETTWQSPAQESTPMKMTRKEAIDRLDPNPSYSLDPRELLVDSLAALGLLQLSEPEPDKIEKFMDRIGVPRNKEYFLNTLDYFDLKIVEK